MTGISAFLVVKNEEKNIRKCLDSIKNIVDDIIIVHDGECIDKTLEIAKEYTNRIYIEKETKNPEYLKVKYLNLNKKRRIFKNKYILSIDADEEISPELREEISNLDIGKFDCYYIRRKNHNQKIEECKYYLRLFNINKVKLFGFYHNDFQPLKNSKIKYLNGLILHHTKNKSFTDWAHLEAIGLKNRFYNFYNFSFIDRLKIEIMLFLKTKIFLRKLYRQYLFKKYCKKYGLKVAKKRIEYFDLLTEYLIKLRKK